MNSNAPRIRIENLSLSFGGLKSLVYINVDIRDKEILAIIGPNGACKTCLLNCINGFYKPQHNKSIGGLTLAYKTPGVYMLEDRDDLTVVWDIRVLSEYRYQGIGTILFQKAIEWARDKHCTQLKVETQNVNEPACRFYVKQGCKLGGLNRFAYQEDPLTREEVQLLWYLNI